MENRIKFHDIDIVSLPDEKCRATVNLAWGDGVQVSATAEGSDTKPGALRCAAEATVRALEQAVGNKVRFNLLGVKAIGAFDAMVVVVSLSGQFDEVVQRLVGSCIIRDDPPRAVALAVLSATNRLMGDNVVFLH